MKLSRLGLCEAPSGAEFWFPFYVEKLQAFLKEKKKKNPSYSTRAFAQHLGIDSGTLSALLQGKRALPAKAREKAAADEIAILTEWEHFAILSLMTTQDFRDDAQWISKRLGPPLLASRS